MLESRADMNDDPFMHAFGITRDMNKTMWNYIECVMRGDDFVAEEIAQIKLKIFRFYLFVLNSFILMFISFDVKMYFSGFRWQ